MRSAANTARSLMGFKRARVVEAPSESCGTQEESQEPEKSKSVRVGSHDVSSVRFLRKTYQQTRLVLTQHNLDVPPSDDEISDEEEAHEALETKPGAMAEASEASEAEALELQPSPSQKSLSRQSTKSSSKVKQLTRKEQLWGKMKAMYQGTQQAIRERNRKLKQVQVAVKETVEHQRATKRMQEAFANAFDAGALLSSGVDPMVAERFQEIMEDAMEYKTLDRVTFGQNVMAAVMGEAEDAQDQGYFEAQDSLLEASQEAADEIEEQKLESRMWSILQKVEDLKDLVARARAKALERLAERAKPSSEELHCGRSIEEEQPLTQDVREVTQDTDSTSSDDVVAEVVPVLPEASPLPAKGLGTPADHGDLMAEGDREPVEPASAMGVELLPEDPHMALPKPGSASPGSSKPVGPTTTPKSPTCAARCPKLAYPRAQSNRSQARRMPKLTCGCQEANQHRHAATVEDGAFGAFEASRPPTLEEGPAQRVSTWTPGGRMAVVGQAPHGRGVQTPLARRGLPGVVDKAGSAGSKPRFPVMPMFPSADAGAQVRKTTPKPLQPEETFRGIHPAEGEIQPSWSFSKTAGSGRFDYALSPVPISQVVRTPVRPSRSDQSQPKRRPSPAGAPTVIDHFPLPVLPGARLDEDDLC